MAREKTHLKNLLTRPESGRDYERVTKRKDHQVGKQALFTGLSGAGKDWLAEYTTFRHTPRGIYRLTRMTRFAIDHNVIIRYVVGIQTYLEAYAHVL